MGNKIIGVQMYGGGGGGGGRSVWYTSSGIGGHGHVNVYTYEVPKPRPSPKQILQFNIQLAINRYGEKSLPIIEALISEGA